MSKARSQTSSKGKIAEEKAAEYLEKLGFRILQRNYRFGRSEIDIIVQNDSKPLLVFIEVKYRETGRYGHPEAFVTDAQADRIRAAADEFIHQMNWKGNIRFDIISLEGSQNRGSQDWELTHFEDAIF